MGAWCLVAGLGATAYGVQVPRCRTTGKSTLEVDFDVESGFDLHAVELYASADASRPFALSTSLAFPVEVAGLAPNATVFVAVRSHPASEPTIAWGPGWASPSGRTRCLTSSDDARAMPAFARSSPESRFLRVYRISEYAFDVDYLANHDAASLDAMALYLMTCDPAGTCAPWSVRELTSRWDECAVALGAACGSERGLAFECLRCADAHRRAIEASCGAFSDQDTLHGEGSYSVHWWCGLGWPESTPAEGPISEYCVEHLPAPAPPASGYSQYLSCNSDEVDAVGNVARDPSCVCICYDDRILAHQTLEELSRDCFVGELEWVNETVCNCTGTLSPIPSGSSDAAKYVGRADVFLPYVGVALDPSDYPPESTLAGRNYHFPKGGACAEGAPLGVAGCTWRRASPVRMLYGDDLLAAGWDRAFVPDLSDNASHTRANLAAFRDAVSKLDACILPTICL